MGKGLGHSTLQYIFSVETEDKTIDSEEDENIDNGDSYELEEEFGDDYVEVEYSGTKDVAPSESRSLPEAEQPGEDYMDAPPVKPKTYDHKPKSYRAPKTYETPKPYKAPRTYEAPKTYDAPKTYQAPKTYKSPKTYDAPKTYETTPKTYEAPKTYDAPKTYEAPKTYDTPKPYKAPKTYQTPKPYGAHKH